MKFSFSLLVSLAALALSGFSFYTSQKTAVPHEISNADWIRSLPDQPGAWRVAPLSEELELLGYSGCRLFARMPAVDLKPDEVLHYTHGMSLYDGPPGPALFGVNTDKMRVLREGPKADETNRHGGGGFTKLPLGLEYTVFYRHDVEKRQVMGFERFAFVFPDHRESSRPQSFSFDAPPGGATFGANDLVIKAADKVIDFAYASFIPSDNNGNQDLEHAVVAKWSFVFRVGPRRQ
jgi:hypothetical protein